MTHLKPFTLPLVCQPIAAYVGYRTVGACFARCPARAHGALLWGEQTDATPRSAWFLSGVTEAVVFKPGAPFSFATSFNLGFSFDHVCICKGGGMHVRRFLPHSPGRVPQLQPLKVALLPCTSARFTGSESGSFPRPLAVAEGSLGAWGLLGSDRGRAALVVPWVAPADAAVTGGLTVTAQHAVLANHDVTLRLAATSLAAPFLSLEIARSRDAVKGNAAGLAAAAEEEAGLLAPVARTPVREASPHSTPPRASWPTLHLTAGVLTANNADQPLTVRCEAAGLPGLEEGVHADSFRRRLPVDPSAGAQGRDGARRAGGRV